MAEVVTQCDCGQLPPLPRNQQLDAYDRKQWGATLSDADLDAMRAKFVAAELKPVARGCEACGAEAGEECRPMCIGLAAELDRIEEEGCSCCQARSLAGQAYHECARCGHLGKSHVTCNKPIPGTESSAAPQ